MEKMSIFGVGRRCAIVLFAGLALALGTRWLMPAAFSLFGYRDAIRPLAFALIAFGLPMYLWGGVTVMKAYHADRLCLSGAYSLCRHPLYGSWAVLILPGVLLCLMPLLWRRSSRRTGESRKSI